MHRFLKHTVICITFVDGKERESNCNWHSLLSRSVSFPTTRANRVCSIVKGIVLILFQDLVFCTLKTILPIFTSGQRESRTVWYFLSLTPNGKFGAVFAKFYNFKLFKELKIWNMPGRKVLVKEPHMLHIFYWTLSVHRLSRSDSQTRKIRLAYPSHSAIGKKWSSALERRRGVQMYWWKWCRFNIQKQCIDGWLDDFFVKPTGYEKCNTREYTCALYFLITCTPTAQVYRIIWIAGIAHGTTRRIEKDYMKRNTLRATGYEWSRFQMFEQANTGIESTSFRYLPHSGSGRMFLR